MDKVWEYLVENPYWFAIIAVVIAAIVVALVLLLSVHKIKYYSCGGKAVPAFRARRGALVIMPKPEREGYIFGGWYFDPAYTRIAIIATMPRQSVKVYAKWMRPLAPQEGSDGKPITFLPTSEESAPAKPKSFIKQLKASSNFNKGAFGELCAFLLGYKGVRLRYTRREALFRANKEDLVRAVMSGNTLKVFFALDPQAYDYKVYHQKIATQKWAEPTPFLLTVRSERGKKYLMRLAEDVVKAKQLEPRAKYKPADYETYVLARGGSAMTKAGLSELIVERINVQDVSVLSDEDAQRMTEIKKIAPLPQGAKIQIVNIGTLSEYFADGTRVDLNALRRKKLVDEDAQGFKVIGKNTLERSLTVVANGYNMSAVKMILLAGGRPILLREELPVLEEAAATQADAQKTE